MNVAHLYRIFTDQREELQSKNFAQLCPRTEESQIDINSALAQVVIGVRRSGKSTMCEKVLVESGVNFAYVNFDDDRLIGLKSDDFDHVLDALYQIYGDFSHVFFDEIQNIAHWELFVSRLLRQNKKIIITGSNSKLLSSELTTHLTGRHKKIELYPFSFVEYCNTAGVDLQSMSTKGEALRKQALSKYLKGGGLPELIFESDKVNYVESLLNSIIKTDISKRFRVRYVEMLKRLASTLCDNFCQEFVPKELAKKFGVSDHTIDNYYGYCKEAFFLQGINKFSYKSVERIRHEKMYVVDLSFVSDRFNTLSTENLGWRLENVVFIELLRRYHPSYTDIFYYKEKQWEVDFLVVKNGNVKQAIQVAYDVEHEKTLKREIKALVKAAEKFNCSDLLLINFNERREVVENGHHIQIIPAAEWLCANKSTQLPNCR